MSVGHVSRRLLFLAPFPARLDGTHGGSRVIAQLLWALSGRHQTAVLYLRNSDEPPIDERLTARCATVEEISRGGEGPATRFRRRLAALQGVPRWPAAFSVDRFGRRAGEMVRRWSPDIVHFEYHVMGQYAAAMTDAGPRRILTQYEPGLVAAQESRRASLGLAGLRDRLDCHAWQRYERRIMAAMDAIVVFTERDRSALIELAGATPISVIPLGGPLPARPLDPLGVESPGPELLFIGSFIHPPNAEAASRLVEEIFPRVRSRCPGSTLHIIGSEPPAVLRASAGAGVHLLGRVSEVEPYLDRASLVVAPLRSGGGMRVKVLEALAHGKALVASRRALEGLAVQDGVHVMVAESDADFVETIVGLLDAPERRRALGIRAREWAVQNLGEERWVADYERLYDALLSGPRPRRRP